MKKNNTVAVLVSTYNGEKYIKEQLDSILNQTYKNIKVFVRDDGSNDSTINILKEYKDKIYFIKGKNLGITCSFKDLLTKAKNFNYYAFCDQDDVWDKNKIKFAVEKLNEVNNDSIPILYASSFANYDKNMKFLSNANKKTNISFENSLFETVSPGMTMVFNQKAKEYFCSTVLNQKGLHDGWMNRICSGIGKVIYDDRVTVYYRRYEGTTTVSKTNIFKSIFWDFKLMIFGDHFKNIHNELVSYKNCFYQLLDDNKKKVLDLFTKRKNIIIQMKKLFYPKKFKNSLKSEILFRLMIFIWKI